MAVAAAGIFTSYTSMMTMVVVGICQGMQPIIGYNYGAGRFDRLRRTFWLAVGVSTVIVTTGQTIGLLFPEYIGRAFSNDPALISETARCLHISLLAFTVVGFQVVSTTLFSVYRQSKIFHISFSDEAGALPDTSSACSSATHGARWSLDSIPAVRPRCDYGDSRDGLLSTRAIPKISSGECRLLTGRVVEARHMTNQQKQTLHRCINNNVESVVI